MSSPGSKPLHIVLLNQAFHPDVVATAQMSKDLADHLVRRGHRVTAVASRSIYGKSGAVLPKQEELDVPDGAGGVAGRLGVRRVGASVFGKTSIAARVADFALFYLLAAFRVLTLPRPDVVISFTTPPFIALVGILCRALRGSKAVYWVMDLYPDLPVACGVMRAGALPTRLFERLNRFLLRRSDVDVVLGRCMEERVLGKRVAPERVVRIPVWSDLTGPAPRERIDALRREWGLGDATVVMYSGNFGLGHDAGTICDAMALLKDDPSIRFVFVGGGEAPGGGRRGDRGPRADQRAVARLCAARAAERVPRARGHPPDLAEGGGGGDHGAEQAPGDHGGGAAVDLRGQPVVGDRPGAGGDRRWPRRARGGRRGAGGGDPRSRGRPPPARGDGERGGGRRARAVRRRGGVPRLERTDRVPRRRVARAGASEGADHAVTTTLAPDTLPPGAAFVLDPLPGSRRSGHEFLVLEPPGRTLKKYVFIQDDANYLPRVLDKFLREFADSTAGVNIQANTQGKRTLLRTAMDLYKVYGFSYWQWKVRQVAFNKIKGNIVNGLLGSTRRCYTVASVAKKYGVPVHYTDDVNSEAFRGMLRGLGVEFIVSISGTQLYKKELRRQTPFGIVNCHGALLPRYRGLMPSFWTLANGETWGGSSVHYVDKKLDNGPIVVQRRYRVWPHDTLEDIMARSKDLAAEAIIECVRLVEAGNPPLLPNREEEMTHFAMPTKEDVARFREHGHRFR